MKWLIEQFCAQFRRLLRGLLLGRILPGNHLGGRGRSDNLFLVETTDE